MRKSILCLILRLTLCLICIELPGMLFATPAQLPKGSIAIANQTAFTVAFQVLYPQAKSWTTVSLGPGDNPILSSFACLRISTGQPPSTRYYPVLAGSRYAFTVDGHEFVLQTNGGGGQTNPVAQANESDKACIPTP